MTRIKLCGLRRVCDVETANELKPEYAGFVFAPGSKRYVSPAQARELRERLHPGIQAVGVFVDENPQAIAELLGDGTIDIAQLHGKEGEGSIRKLRALTGKPIIKAFRAGIPGWLGEAARSSADFILLDSGAGTGRVFDWSLLQGMERPYFLAGGLAPENVSEAIRVLHPYAVDVSSGIETDGYKDDTKMAAFVAAARKEDGI